MTHRLAYDLKLRKVGCVLLQASMCGSARIAQMIPTEHWLLHPTPDLKVYAISDDDVLRLIEYHGGIVPADRKGLTNK